MKTVAILTRSSGSDDWKVMNYFPGINVASVPLDERVRAARAQMENWARTFPDREFRLAEIKGSSCSGVTDWEQTSLLN